MIEIRFHGRGGQGAVTAAELMAQAAIVEKKYAQGFPNFGPERRGAPVTAFLRISNAPIYSREKIDKPDVVVVLDASLLHLVDVCEGLKPGGTLIMNISEQNTTELKDYTDRYQLATVNADRIAIETLGIPITNTAIIGALIRAKALTKIVSLTGPMQQRFGKLAEKNINAMKRAYKETVLFDLPPNETRIEPKETVRTYEDILKNEALLEWEQVEIGCDIDRPGSSADFFTGNWRTTGKPVTDREKCIKCGFCWILCPDMAYRVNADGYYDWDGRYCKGCGICVEECPKGSIEMREE